MPPGVDLARWTPGDRFTRPAKPVCDLLFVGGDFERKGGPELLAWALRSKRRDFRLHLVTREKLGDLGDPRVRVYNGLMPNDPELVALYAQCRRLRPAHPRRLLLPRRDRGDAPPACPSSWPAPAAPATSSAPAKPAS